MTPYRLYSEFLKERFGEKVYKLPVNLNGTCPNRDGTKGVGGCIFCGEGGGSFENVPGSIKTQLLSAKEKAEERYKAHKFIAYFQNYTSTYCDLDVFKQYVEEAKIEGVVGFSFSTRPDALSDEYLNYIEELQRDYFVTLEIGLQTVNYKTLKILNRGHDLADFIDVANRCRERNIRVCAHVILDLPWDDRDDVLECAKILNVLSVEEVKIHSLYIVKNTVLGKMYLEGEIKLLSLDEYKERVILFLQNLDSETVVQRIVGRAPQEDTIVVNHNRSWWKIRDDIVNTMNDLGYFQGQNVKG